MAAPGETSPHTPPTDLFIKPGSPTQAWGRRETLNYVRVVKSRRLGGRDVEMEDRGRGSDGGKAITYPFHSVIMNS